MATQSTLTRYQAARASTDTDQRHLLADSLSPSETASAATSIYDNGDMPARVTSPARSSQSHPRHASIAAPERAFKQASYRGFSSEQAYLNALRAWADGKKYEQPTDTTLYGFYGATTMEEYAGRQPAFQGLGLRKKWKARKAGKAVDRPAADQERRATVV